jgi:hypothetical protein
MIGASMEFQSATTQKQGSKSAIALCKLLDCLNLCSTIVSSAAQMMLDSSSAHAFGFFAFMTLLGIRSGGHRGHVGVYG